MQSSQIQSKELREAAAELRSIAARLDAGTVTAPEALAEADAVFDRLEPGTAAASKLSLREAIQ
jgi:hypothetical protein